MFPFLNEPFGTGAFSALAKLPALNPTCVLHTPPGPHGREVYRNGG